MCKVEDRNSHVCGCGGKLIVQVQPVVEELGAGQDADGPARGERDVGGGAERSVHAPVVQEHGLHAHGLEIRQLAPR